MNNSSAVMTGLQHNEFQPRFGDVYRVPVLSIDMEHISETVKTKIMEATKKVKVNKKEAKKAKEGEEEESDDDLASMADDCYEILDSDEERQKVVHVMEKNGKPKSSAKACSIDPAVKKETVKKNNEISRTVKKINTLISDALKKAQKAHKSLRCTDQLKQAFEGSKKIQRECTKVLNKLAESNKMGKTLSFSHELETVKELKTQLPKSAKAVEQLDEIAQGMNEEEMENAFDLVRKSKKREATALNVD